MSYNMKIEGRSTVSVETMINITHNLHDDFSIDEIVNETHLLGHSFKHRESDLELIFKYDTPSLLPPKQEGKPRIATIRIKDKETMDYLMGTALSEVFEVGDVENSRQYLGKSLSNKDLNLYIHLSYEDPINK